MTVLNAAARDVLATLAHGEGRRLDREAIGAWRLNGQPVDDATVAALRRADLIDARGDRPAINACGRGWLARAAAPDAPNRLPGRRRLAPRDAVDREVVEVNRAENPLAWLAKRGMLNATQLAASERLRGDFAMASLGPRVTMRWDTAGGGSGGGGMDASSSQIAARARFRSAVAAVGPGLADIVWRVVCDGEGLEGAERALGWPARAGKLVLTLALDRLATHYRID